MPFKDTGEGVTCYLDENGDVVDPLEGESLERWREWQRAIMNESADEIRERLGIQ